MAYYEEYAGAVKQAAQKHGVNENLIWAVIEQESSGNPAAVSSAGAVGLMQLMPATAKQYGVTDRTDPVQNIMGGTALLSDLLDRYDGDTESALAAYYAGPGNVSRFGKEKYKTYYTGVLSKVSHTGGGSSFDVPETEDTVFGMGDSGLVWWGDIVLIVLILLCILLAVAFLYLAINGSGNPVDLVKGMIK